MDAPGSSGCASSPRDADPLAELRRDGGLAPKAPLALSHEVSRARFDGWDLRGPDEGRRVAARSFA